MNRLPIGTVSYRDPETGKFEKAIPLYADELPDVAPVAAERAHNEAIHTLAKMFREYKEQRLGIDTDRIF